MSALNQIEPLRGVGDSISQAVRDELAEAIGVINAQFIQLASDVTIPAELLARENIIRQAQIDLLALLTTTKDTDDA